MMFDKNNIQQLLAYALEERHTEAVLQLHQFLADEPALQSYINETLSSWITTEPDAVYFFGRTILAHDYDEQWLPLLSASARASLQIVIAQGDSESIMEWLRLIAREPANYHLNDVLREAILSAQACARIDGALGVRLLLFALKRACDLAEVMITDEAFVASLTAPIGVALQTFQSYAIKESIEAGRDLGLLALAHALASAPENDVAASVFTPDIIIYLWAVYLEADTVSYLTPALQPATLITTLIDASTAWLHPDATDTLLRMLLSAPTDPLLMELSKKLATQDKALFLAQVAKHYAKLAIPPEGVILAITQLLEAQIISQEEALQLYYQLGTSHDWKNVVGKAYLEQLGRLLQQNATLTLAIDALQKLLTVAGEHRLESAGKTILKRIQIHLEAPIEEEAHPIETFLELHEQTQWSNNLQTQWLAWWRTYALSQPLARLQQFDKAFEGKRTLEPLRAIIQTTIAIRKLLGKRTLSEFATMLNATFSLLQLLSDSFDPQSSKPMHFDAGVVNLALEGQASELTAHERSVLAKDLRELAELITDMADYRSKASLIRREDNIERQLISGEQMPQSAIDAMRWLSGFLGRLP